MHFDLIGFVVITLSVMFKWQLRLELLVEMFKRFCYMSKWNFLSPLNQCILYADFVISNKTSNVACNLFLEFDGQIMSN